MNRHDTLPEKSVHQAEPELRSTTIEVDREEFMPVLGIKESKTGRSRKEKNEKTH